MEEKFRLRIGMYPFQYYIYLRQVAGKNHEEAFVELQFMMDEIWKDEQSYYENMALELFGKE